MFKYKYSINSEIYNVTHYGHFINIFRITFVENIAENLRIASEQLIKKQQKDKRTTIETGKGMCSNHHAALIISQIKSPV